ncbi:transmembrane secretion effector [Homoserinimonas aerilata]|uniref:Transmembrane secretion effector n=1 Tax=Homoserinimonas aerilata TaxID=1162970 RepID=A0A542YGG4_9MICO|nr:MFS transporter [Homoserinimonas aerilata]TQL47190.1 transmembrane secretion effector [Homoserinimonas aerilata]
MPDSETPSTAGRRGHLIDLTPLRVSPAFARLWAGNAIAGIGGQMTIVAVGLHLYAITGSTFAVAMVGTIALLPMILAGLYGGMLADAFDRRAVALGSAIAAWLSTVGIALVAWFEVEQLWPFYMLTTINSIAATVIGTSRAAIIPRLVPRELLPAASALSGVSMGVMVTVGPALAGILVATVGFGWTYTIDVIMFSAAFMGILTLPSIRPEAGAHPPGLKSVVQGIAFLRRAPNIRMSFIVDIVAMTFGRPHALFPAVGALVIGGGAVTVGILTAAGAVGTLLCSLLSGRLGTVRRHGVAIGWAIAVYGVFVAGFGVVLAVLSLGGFERATESIAGANVLALVLAAVMMAGTGASDNVSAIFRSTMMQTAVPDNMRGRLQGIFTVVVTGGPRLGDLYVGAISLAAGLWFPPLLGGLLIIALIALCMRATPSFRAYDALNPTP